MIGLLAETPSVSVDPTRSGRPPPWGGQGERHENQQHEYFLSHRGKRLVGESREIWVAKPPWRPFSADLTARQFKRMDAVRLIHMGSKPCV